MPPRAAESAPIAAPALEAAPPSLEAMKAAAAAPPRDRAALRRAVLISLLASAYGAGASAGPTPTAAPALRLEALKIVETRRGETSPLELEIANSGAETDRLLGAVSEQFDLVALVDAAGAPLAALEIPAGERRRLGPNGDAALLLGDPRKPLFEGRRAALTLRFEKAGLIPVETRVAARPSGGLSLRLGARAVETEATGAQSEGFSQKEHDAR